MRERYSFKEICNYLKIDNNKMVNFNELWDILYKIKSQFDVVFNNEYDGYCIMNAQEIGMGI